VGAVVGPAKGHFKREGTRTQEAGEASVQMVPNPVAAPGELLLRVQMVGFCGSDLNSFRGRNSLVTFPRIPGHEVSATVIEGDGALPAGTDLALSPYTNCGRCASCRRGRSNACEFNQTLGVQSHERRFEHCFTRWKLNAVELRASSAPLKQSSCFDVPLELRPIASRESVNGIVSSPKAGRRHGWNCKRSCASNVRT
jgi:hypothetical protein